MEADKKKEAAMKKKVDKQKKKRPVVEDEDEEEKSYYCKCLQVFLFSHLNIIPMSNYYSFFEAKVVRLPP